MKSLTERANERRSLVCRRVCTAVLSDERREAAWQAIADRAYEIELDDADLDDPFFAGEGRESDGAVDLIDAERAGRACDELLMGVV